MRKTSLTTVYRTLQRLGYACLVPRPRHEKQDLEAQRQFREEIAPLFVHSVSQQVAKAGGQTRIFFMDEARFGQQGTLKRVWAPKGSRPTAVEQTRYEWVYLYAAVEPATGASVALQASHVNTGTMSAFLGILARELDEGDHAIVVGNRRDGT